MRKTIIAITILTSSGVYFGLFSQIFSLRTVECEGCADIITAEIHNYLGENIFMIKRSEINRKLLEADITLAAVKIKIKLPNKLIVDLIKKTPEFRLTNEVESQGYLLVDSDGWILSKEQGGLNDGLPIVILPEARGIGISEKIPQKIIRAAEIVGLLQDNYKTRGRGIVNDNILDIKIIDGPLVRFDLNKNAIEAVRALQLTMDQVRIGAVKLETIDLRFNNPIVIN